jgi:N,N'-diacetyllegionaminate synthase
MKIIAEIANVHEGSENYLLNLVNVIVENNIMDVKLQYILPEEFGSEESDNYIEFERLQINENYIKNTILPKLINSRVYFDVFGKKSFYKVLELNQQFDQVIGVKFHSTNSMEFELLKKAAIDFEIVFVSISGLTAVEIFELYEFIKNTNSFGKFIFSYGVQTYPTELKNIKLNKLTELRRIFDIPIGLSEHLDGDLQIAKDIIKYAWLLGYEYIEKHVTLDRSRRLDDDHSALELNELVEAINDIENISELFTNDVLRLSDSEVSYRNNAKKVLYYSRSLNPKHEVVKEDIYAHRQEHSLSLNYINWDNILNINTSKSVKKGELVTRSSIHQIVHALIIVRSSSNRLPEKCYKHICGLETIRILIRRVLKTKNLNRVILCTTNTRDDDGLESIAIEEGIDCFRGDENVHDRLEGALNQYEIPDFIVRLTGDNLLVDPLHLDLAINNVVHGDFQYYKHNKVIDGCDFEIIGLSTFRSLSKFYSNFTKMSEYMTLYLDNQLYRKMVASSYDFVDYRNFRLTLDYIEDYDNLSRLLNVSNNIQIDYVEICSHICMSGVYKSFDPQVKADMITVKQAVIF